MYDHDKWIASERRRMNEESRRTAQNCGSSWTQTEHDLVLEWDGENEQDLHDLAELLGRTVEAVRQRFYAILAGRKDYVIRSTVTRTVTTTTVRTDRYRMKRNHETRWSPEDEDEWPSDWYVR